MEPVSFPSHKNEVKSWWLYRPVYQMVEQSRNLDIHNLFYQEA
jgi:hypothetical protein